MLHWLHYVTLFAICYIDYALCYIGCTLSFLAYTLLHCLQYVTLVTLCYIGYTLNNLAYTLLPCLHCCPWYPRLQPFRQVPLMWWHCSSLTQLPHASAQSWPKVWLSHSEFPIINTDEIKNNVIRFTFIHTQAASLNTKQQWSFFNAEHKTKCHCLILLYRRHVQLW